VALELAVEVPGRHICDMRRKTSLTIKNNAGAHVMLLRECGFTHAPTPSEIHLKR
jgi:hypothetical protein